MTHTTLDHPFPIPPAFGATLEVFPGVHWLRMPLPFALDHINLWLLEDGDGWAIVDTGVNDETTRALWVQVLAGKRVTRLIGTHFHPDHVGLAGWLAERHDVPLTSTLGEWSFGRMLMLDLGEEYHANQVEHYRRAGFDEDLLSGIRERSGSYRSRIAPLPQSISTIRDGSRLTIGGRQWQVIVGSGHSPEHACLWCADSNVLIAGDQVLPRISPNVGVWPQQPDGNPLQDFLDSQIRLKTLPDDCLVLPSHVTPFRGLHGRCDELIDHHHQRLGQVLEAAGEPVTALELTGVLFRRALDPQHMGFAMGETLAHANYLIARGDLARETRADGVWLYRRTKT